MAINVCRGTHDEVIDQIIEALRAYEVDHPKAQIDLYRQNPVSVRIRIIDPDFSRVTRPRRHEQIWKYLDELSEEVQSDISTILLLTPKESKLSFANFEFEEPVTSL